VRRLLPWVVAGSLVVVAGVIAGVVLLTGGPDLSTSRAAADAAAAAFEANDVGEMEAIACESADGELTARYDYFTHDPSGSTGGISKAEVTRVIGREEYTSVAAEVRIDYAGNHSTDSLVGLVKENDAWCVDRLGV
jgi:hypothetical protein